MQQVTHRKRIKGWQATLLVLMGVLVSMVAACGQQPTTTTAPTDVAASPAANAGDAGETQEDTAAPTGDPITIGSKQFTEQFIIGEMYALLLEEAGFTVERKLNLGGTPVAQAALENGEIDLFPEYTGTGLLTVLKLPVNSDSQEVYATVSRAYQEQFNVVWLDAAPMNNTQSLAMTREKAEEYGITTVSDMVAHANDLIMIGPPEFQEREDGLPGLKKVYGDFTLKEYKGVEHGLRYQGVTTGQADVVVAFGTDGEISAFDLVVLEDDKKLFPPYQIAPIVRQDVLDAHPDIATALNELAPLLTNETMRQLNYEVSGNQQEPADVAKKFLIEKGLIAE